MKVMHFSSFLLVSLTCILYPYISPPPPPYPPDGKGIPTELRSEATDLQKKMKYDDTEREGLSSPLLSLPMLKFV